jgi:hypothetical protein
MAAVTRGDLTGPSRGTFSVRSLPLGVRMHPCTFQHWTQNGGRGVPVRGHLTQEEPPPGPAHSPGQDTERRRPPSSGGGDQPEPFPSYGKHGARCSTAAVVRLHGRRWPRIPLPRRILSWGHRTGLADLMFWTQSGGRGTVSHGRLAQAPSPRLSWDHHTPGPGRYSLKRD